MRLIALLFSISSFSFNLWSQNYISYYNKVNEGENAIFNKEYTSAYNLISEAFNIESPHAKDYYLLAVCLDEMDSVKNKKKIKKCLLDASIKGGNITHWLGKRPLNIILSKRFLKRVNRKYRKWMANTESIRDTILYFERNDQEFRKLFSDSIKMYYSEESVEYQNGVKELRLKDSSNQVEFLEYVMNNGYPGINVSGTDRIATLILHVLDCHIEAYDSVLLEQLKMGNIEPFYYGSMIDRIRCYIEGKAYYYAYPSNNSCFPSEVEIIQNRIHIGMSPFFQGPRRFVNIEGSKKLEINLK